MRIAAKLSFLVLASLLAVSAPLFAHHGNAEYVGKQITIKGTVTAWIWTNPHSILKVDVTDDKGNIVHWICENNAPSTLVNFGYTPKTFKPGDQLLVSFVPAKGDRHFGTCIQFVFVADGKRLGGNGRCGMGAEAVDANTLPIKPGYTAVEVQMPKDTRARPESEQEQ